MANILRCVPAATRHALQVDDPTVRSLVAVARAVGVQGAHRLAHRLIDCDGRVIGSHLALPNGPLMAEAPMMAASLRELVAGGQVGALRAQAAAILRRIDRGRPREPGEDDE